MVLCNSLMFSPPMNLPFIKPVWSLFIRLGRKMFDRPAIALAAIIFIVAIKLDQDQVF